MNKICDNCEEEFETKRKDTKFCSDKCRKASSRNVTESRNVTNDNVTDKPDNETRQWLIEQFQAEDKPSDEIESIMQAQDTYYSTRQHYFIPARMLALRV